jgi:hypothetical protein
LRRIEISCEVVEVDPVRNLDVVDVCDRFGQVIELVIASTNGSLLLSVPGSIETSFTRQIVRDALALARDIAIGVIHE